MCSFYTLNLYVKRGFVFNLKYEFVKTNDKRTQSTITKILIFFKIGLEIEVSDKNSFS